MNMTSTAIAAALLLCATMAGASVRAGGETTVAKGTLREFVEPAPLASDGEFLRRLFGDTLDRAPTRAELAAFEADADPAKRALEIDRVLATSSFSARWASVRLRSNDRAGPSA